MIAAPDFLPLGSVVRLKSEDKAFMIVSRGVTREEDGERVYYDYRLCFYPEGYTNAFSVYADHNAVETVLHYGFNDEDNQSYLKVLRSVLENGELKRAGLKEQLEDVW